MIDPNLFTNCLQFCPIFLDYVSVIKPGNKYFNWTRATQNIYGLTELRARVGKFDLPWGAKSHFPVPDLEQNFDKHFFDIMDQRAQDILAYAKIKNKKIVVQWSGGIDSTGIMSALIKNLSAADSDMLMVCTTTAGINENPYFYATQIQGRFAMTNWYQLDFCNEFLDHHILLNGDPGDCILGPSTGKFKSLWPDRQYLKPWKQNKSILYGLYYDNVAPDFAGWWVNSVSDNLQELQDQGLYTNVQTIADWHWWLYYNLKWQGSMTRCISANKKDAKEFISRDKIQEFFDLNFYAHEDFQIWSYQNLQNLLSTGISNHKRLLKDYIYDLDKNEHYLENKIKIASGVPVLYMPFLVDANAIHYRHYEPGVAEALHEIFES